MRMRDQAAFWAVALLILGGVLWLLGDALLPFVAGAAMAYLLDPITGRLMRLGLPRALAVSLIIFGMIGATVALLVGVIPPLVAEAGRLAQTLPDLADHVLAALSERFPALVAEDGVLMRNLEGIGEALRQRGMALAEGALGAVSGLISVVLFIIVAPVVTFYLLLDWPRVVARIDALLPRDHAPTIRDLARRIDRALAGFVRGQLSVCLLLAGYYAIGLMLAGLQFGLVIGVIAGLISFIPFVGAIIGGVLSIGLALFQFWGDPVPIIAVAAIFAIGQFLEGNVLVPRLVGGSVGLHPVWLLFAVTAFGTLFGFTGMLVAVPVAAAAGVLVKFAVARYMDSPLYRASGSAAPASTTDPEDRPPP
ncbi:MAG: AI-2E family transporter [Rhodobacteraceae bacterium]|nr:AI-2E family transporter [Paracoccaceae bacterium]